MAKGQNLVVCNHTWGTCPTLTINPKRPEPHRCGEYIFPGDRHAHICMGCSRPK